MMHRADLATEWRELPADPTRANGANDMAPGPADPDGATGANGGAPELDVYYDDKGQRYFRREASGRYIGAPSASIRRLLKSLGFPSKASEGERLSPLDVALERIETTQNVAYAAPLAGHSAGVIECHGRRLLITDSPRLIDPKPGAWDTLGHVFDGLLGGEQCSYFFAWLKVALDALRRQIQRPGQCLVIAGPRQCGKSLVQALITQLLGGRSGKPYGFMCGTTDFNSELFQAEHLVIEDEAASSDPRIRKAFGAQIKTFTVNRDQRCHAKNREALMLPPFWRLSITLNDDAPSLLVLPTLDDGLSDKLMLLQAQAFQWPVDTSTPTGEQLLWRSLIAELPAFVHSLGVFQIAASRREPRFGVATYHNPELLKLMDAATDETRLLDLIDSKLFESKSAGWTGEDASAPWLGRASELEELLILRCGNAARRLFYHNSACGSLLGQLARKHTARVRARSIVGGHTRWEITPADETEAGTTPPPTA